MTATVIQLVKPTLRDPWTLEHAVDLCMEQHWRNTRKAATMASWTRELLRVWPDKTLDAITTQDIDTYIRLMEADGLATWTMHAKVCCISKVYDIAKRNGYPGDVPYIPTVHIKKPLKWWLTPEKERPVIAWLRAQGKLDVADYVEWTIETGLRVEETLRVHSGHFLGLYTAKPELTVPGTKTDGSQGALALSTVAAGIAQRRHMALGGMEARLPMFPLDYMQLMRVWQRVRKEFGWMDDSTATLKALRRSFARRLAANGAPLPVIQSMMRHGDPQTTMGYLRLVGGAFTTEEQRKWLA